MRLPLPFRRENSSAAQREREAAVEKVVTEGLRSLATLLQSLAGHIEKRRLERDGYEKQDTYLERANQPPKR